MLPSAPAPPASPPPPGPAPEEPLAPEPARPLSRPAAFGARRRARQRLLPCAEQAGQDRPRRRAKVEPCKEPGAGRAQVATSQGTTSQGTTSQSQTAPAQGAPAPAQGGGQASRQPDPAEASGVTNPDWQAIISGGSQTRPDASGNLSVDDAVSTVNVTGDVRTLTISGAMSDVAAQKVEKLVVTASTVNVYVESVKEVEIQGADVNVYWVSGNPTVTGDGANHNVTQITR